MIDQHLNQYQLGPLPLPMMARAAHVVHRLGLHGGIYIMYIQNSVLVRSPTMHGAAVGRSCYVHGTASRLY